VISQLKKGMNINETVKFRVFDLFASISALSLEAFQLCETNGCLQDIVAAIQSDDVLQQLNVIELLEKVQISSYKLTNKIISTHEGSSFLEHGGTLQKLANIISSEDPLVVLLVPRVILFMGTLASKVLLRITCLNSSGRFGGRLFGEVRCCTKAKEFNR
jgi:hypothetical protein